MSAPLNHEANDLIDGDPSPKRRRLSPEKPGTSVGRITLGIVSHILNFVSSPSLLLQLRLVSRSWNHAFVTTHTNNPLIPLLRTAFQTHELPEGGFSGLVTLFTPKSKLAPKRASVRIESEGRTGSVSFCDIGDIEGEELMCTFHRTNRLSYEGGPYPLPPSLGHFPLARVEDYRQQLIPANWREYGGVFFPMNEREAFWIQFQNKGKYAKAVKMGAGNLNVLNGQKWKDQLDDDPSQDYMVIGLPEASQPWLDGHHAGSGYVRQFVATPKGSGLSVEAQLTGEEKFGGIQLLVYVAKEPNPEPKPKNSRYSGSYGGESQSFGSASLCGGGGGGYSFGGKSLATKSVAYSPSSPQYSASSPQYSPTSPAYSPSLGAGAASPYVGAASGDAAQYSPVAPMPMPQKKKKRKRRRLAAAATSAPPPPPPSSGPASGVEIGTPSEMEIAPAITTVAENESEKSPKEEEESPKMPEEMCLAAGGKMAQTIVPDPKGIDFWSQDVVPQVLWIHLVSAEGYEQVTQRKHAASPEAWRHDHWGAIDPSEDTAVHPDLADLKSLPQLEAEMMQ